MIWLIALLGLALRLATMRTQGSYWFDESFSVHFSSMPLSQAVEFFMHDVHPTLYYLLLHVWISIFGDGTTAVRCLSVLLGTLAIVAIGSLAREAFGKRAGWIAAFAATCSPFLLFQSAEARMYPLLLLLIALGTAEFLRLMKDPARPVSRWAMLMCLATFTHLTALTPFIVMAAVRAWSLRCDRKRLGRFLLLSILILVPFMTWFTTAAAARLHDVGREWQLGAGGASAASLSSQFTDFFAQGTMPWQRAFLFPMLILATFGALFAVRSEHGLVWRISASSDRRVWLLLALAIIPFFAFVCITTGVTKYFVVALPACVALAAGGLDRVLPRTRRAAALAALIWLLLLAGPLLTLLLSKRFRYDDVAHFIETREKPGDIVYASWFPTLLPLGREYRGTSPLYSANPYENMMTFDEAIVTHAGQSLTKADLDAVQAKLEAHAKDAGRVFLVTASTGLDASAPIEQLFSARGWILEETYRTNEWTPNVDVFRNPKK